MAFGAREVQFAKGNIAASATDSPLVTAVPGRKIRVLAVIVSCGATASTVTFNSKPAGAGVAASCTLNNSISLPGADFGWFETLAGEGLTVTTGAGSATGINVTYTLLSA